MALARWSDNSDVYIYQTEYGWTIHDSFEWSWCNCTHAEALDILTLIRKNGQKVPDRVFDVLQSQILREDYRRNRHQSYSNKKGLPT